MWGDGQKNESNGFNTNSIHTSSSTIFYSNQYFPNMSNSNTLSNKYRFQTWQYNRVYSGEKQCVAVCQLDEIQQNEKGKWVSRIAAVNCGRMATWITSSGKLCCEEHSKCLDSTTRRIPLLAKEEFDTHQRNMLAAEAKHIPGKPIRKLGDWITRDVLLLDFVGLSGNKNAIDLLEANMDKINWYSLAQNEDAVHLLEANVHMFINDNYFWSMLSINPGAIRMLEQNMRHVNWSKLSKNPAAVHLLHKYPKNIDMVTVWANPNVRDVLRVLSEPFDKLLDYAVSHYTKSKLDNRESTWSCLASNPSPEIIDVVEKSPIRGWRASFVLQESFVHWSTPCIFVLDYAAMRDRMRPFAEELATKAFHPRRVAKWIAAGFEPEDW